MSADLGLTEEQFAAIREKPLTLVSTMIDGSVVVRDLAGVQHLLERDGSVEPYRNDRGVRVDAREALDDPDPEPEL